MLTMTGAEIKAALRRNKRLGIRPWSLMQVAAMKGVSRSIMTRAVQNPRRYPQARRFIESVLAHTAASAPKSKRTSSAA